MEWFKVMPEFVDHPKISSLACELGVTELQAIAHVVCFWSWVARFKERGTLLGVGERDIAKAGRWGKAPSAFVSALVAARLLDRTPEGLVVHDWLTLHEPQLRARDKGRERARRWREREPSDANGTRDETRTVPVTSRVPNANGTRTERVAYGGAVASKEGSKQASEQRARPRAREEATHPVPAPGNSSRPNGGMTLEGARAFVDQFRKAAEAKRARGDAEGAAESDRKAEDLVRQFPELAADPPPATALPETDLDPENWP